MSGWVKSGSFRSRPGMVGIVCELAGGVSGGRGVSGAGGRAEARRLLKSALESDLMITWQGHWHA